MPEAPLAAVEGATTAVQAAARAVVELVLIAIAVGVLGIKTNTAKH